MRALRLLPILLLAACARTVTFDGAEQRPGSPEPVGLAVARVAPQWQGRLIEVRTVDGTVYSGTLLPPPPDAQPASPGGAIPLARLDSGQVLAGTVSAPNAAPLACRFRLLDADYGLRSGGTGACVGNERRIDFAF